MEFRKAVSSDLTSIMLIIQQAQSFLRQQGIDQWQNGYPNREIIDADISQEQAYVISDGTAIAAYGVVSFEPEPTYAIIYNGEWLNNERYAVIHRLAVNTLYRNQQLAGRYLQEAQKLCIKHQVYNIRIDTHELNQIMQHVLAKQGYRCCGEIFLTIGAKRIAFHKTLSVQD
ncbi:MAG: GNAT family N-acetyltransferase [Erysipelotrichaceae bacterium]|nr:GNAT family N-acetyltransferase [Erysipelotrichaceae bacterium]